MTLDFFVDGVRISRECSPHVRLSEFLLEIGVPNCSAQVFRAQDGRTVLAEHELAIRCQGLKLSPVSPGDFPEEVFALTAAELGSLEASSGSPSV